MRRLTGVVLVVAVSATLLAVAAPRASAAPSWQSRIAKAAAFARSRKGIVYFALTDESGRLRGWCPRRAAPSASVLKAMLLVAYLNRSTVRGRALTSYDRSLLAPMIRWSSNSAANRVIGIVGSRAVYRVAHRARMRRFVLHLPVWGLSEITSGDQARFFRRIDSFVPKRHRAYAMHLLATVIPSQRWGIAPARPKHWKIYFKGGWGSGTGRVTHQVALLVKGTTRITIAVLTQFNPNQLYGERTIRGIATRLLKGVT
jgi:hypothetical protein